MTQPVAVPQVGRKANQPGAGSQSPNPLRRRAGETPMQPAAAGRRRCRRSFTGCAGAGAASAAAGASASGLSGEDRGPLRRAGWSILRRQSNPLRRRTRELRLVELCEPAASPKGTRRRRTAWHEGLAPSSGKDETPHPLMRAADHGSRTRPHRAGAAGPPRGVL
jgi:hypothetical protein